MKTNYFLLILTVIFLVSCEGDKIDFTAFKRSINVNASIQGAKTRASNDAWDDGDAIGIFMKNAGELLSPESVLAKNAKYQTQGNGSFTPASVSQDVKFPLDGSAVDFVAYYPHGTVSSAFEYSIDVTNQSNQAAIDLLYADNAKALSNNENVNFSFSHQLSKIIVVLNSIDGSALSDVSVTLKGLNTKGKFSLIDASQTTSSKGNVKMKIADNGQLAEAIVLPTSTLAGVTIEILNGEYGYVYDLNSLPNIVSFESGVRYTFTITLDTRSPLSAAATISDWTDAPGEELTLSKSYEIYEPFGAGTQDNPYTIEDAQHILPVNDVWVKGYIVGYYSGTSQGSFTNDVSDKNTIKDTALALAFTSTETSAKKTFPIQLPGAVRADLNLKTNPNNLGKEVKIRGNIGTYYGAPGMPSVSACEFVSP